MWGCYFCFVCWIIFLKFSYYCKNYLSKIINECFYGRVSMKYYSLRAIFWWYLYRSYYYIQDGPSLESSSYLNMTLRYLGPREPWDPWTFRPWDLWTLGLSNFLPLPSSTTSSFFFLPPSSWFGLVWFGMGGGG